MTDLTPLSASSLIFMAAVQRLGDRANGKTVSHLAKIKASATYNLAARLVANGFLVSQREQVGGFTKYVLTPSGVEALDAVRKALKK